MNKNITTMLTMNRLNDFLQIIGVLGLIASLIFVLPLITDVFY